MYQALKGELTADDMEQMKIDAWDHYKGQGPEAVVGDLKSANELAQRMLSTEIQKLKVDLHDSTLTFRVVVPSSRALAQPRFDPTE